MDEILLNIESKERRYAHLRIGLLHDLIIERRKERQLTGNIYRGRVRNILHNIQSAFIDIDENENGFIHISDILENTKKFEQLFDMDFDLDYDIQAIDSRKQDLDIEQVMKINQPVLVQVIKEPIGTKGARLTSKISIAGRYLVLLPNSLHRGVSRKIEDRGERERLKKLIRAFEMPKGMGLICRTAARNATADQLIAEATELMEAWEMIIANFDKSDKPTLLYEESDLVKRAVTRAVDKKFDRILIDHYPTYQRCKRLYQKYEAEHPLRIEFYRDKVPMFERFNVEREIDKTLRQKLWIGNGGYLLFDRTEAMHTIDVNSGRSTSTENVDIEESLVQINLEAAEEIARQLRLRNIGGLVIIDFIDMRARRNQRRVLERLKECMKDDSAKCTILNMSEFGLVEMTRQRNRESLEQTIFTECPYCTGRGLVKTHESVTIEIERAFKKVVNVNDEYAVRLVVHPELDNYIQIVDKEYLRKMADKMNALIEFETDDTFHLNHFEFFSLSNKRKIEV